MSMGNIISQNNSDMKEKNFSLALTKRTWKSMCIIQEARL